MSPKQRRAKLSRTEDLRSVAAALYERSPYLFAEGVTLEQLTTEILETAKKNRGRPREYEKGDKRTQVVMAVLDHFLGYANPEMRKALGYERSTDSDWARILGYYRSHPKEFLTILKGTQLTVWESRHPDDEGQSDMIKLVIEPSAPDDLPTPILWRRANEAPPGWVDTRTAARAMDRIFKLKRGI
jgi:hypothetical protein